MTDDQKERTESPDEFIKRLKEENLGRGAIGNISQQIGKGLISQPGTPRTKRSEIEGPFIGTREEATERSTPPKEIWHYPPMTPEEEKQIEEAVERDRAQLKKELDRQEAQRQRENSPEFKAKRAAIEAAAKERTEGRRKSGKIDLAKSLTDPIPYKVRQRLGALAVKKGFSDVWTPYNDETKNFFVETLYDAVYSSAVRLADKYDLPNNDTWRWKSDIAGEARQKTVEEICKIALRDKRRTIKNDGRLSQDKPIFTDWVKYVGWVLRVLEKIILGERMAQAVEAERTRELTERDSNDPLPARPIRPAGAGAEFGPPVKGVDFG